METVNKTSVLTLEIFTTSVIQDLRNKLPPFHVPKFYFPHLVLAIRLALEDINNFTSRPRSGLSNQANQKVFLGLWVIIHDRSVHYSTMLDGKPNPERLREALASIALAMTATLQEK